MSDSYEQMTTEELMGAVESIAKNYFDGHLTLMKFTTHWKAAWGTPDLDSGDGRFQLTKLNPYPSLRDALIGLLQSRLQNFHDIDLCT